MTAAARRDATPKRRRRSVAQVASVLVAALALAACASGGAAPAPATPRSPGPTEAASASATAPPPAAATPSPAGSGSARAVIRDDTLLQVLPADIGGVPVTVEEQSFGEAAGDPAFARNVERAAFAVVASGSDLASGVVARLRDGVYGDAFFRDWRETYDTGACSQAGGVATNGEVQLAGRTVYVTTCGGGLRVYHAYLASRNVIVSLFSVGPARFGERLVASLRP